jgi:hypothetical protein
MKLILFIVLFCLPLIQWAQQGMHGSGVDGTGEGGSFSSSFGQFAFENYFTGSSSVSEGVQHPFENSKVAPLYSLFDSILGDGDLLCYNAQLNITVAGDDGDVVIDNGANSDFIAGRSIVFLPGFHAQPGSYVHGHITTNGDFCDGVITQSIVQAQPETKSESVYDEIPPNNLAPETDIKVYPNPNKGSFTIKLINFENKAFASVYSMVGSIVYQSEMEKDNSVEIDLPFIRKGIYFVRVTSGEEQFVKKIIVN